MDQTTIRILFSLLRCAIFGIKLTEAEKNHISPEQLQHMFDAAKKHDISPLISWALKQNQIPADSAEIKNGILLAVYRYERLNSEYIKICTALENAKIPFIPLKGSVIRKYYPEPWMRTSSDIDILLHNEDIESAATALKENCGYAHMTESTHDISLMSSNNVHVELHYDLVEDGLANDSYEVLSSAWESTTKHEGYQYWYDMSDEMFYFYHIAHMAKHFQKGGCGIRPFIDLWFLDNLKGVDFSKREDILNRGGLLNFAQTASRLCKVWFDGEEADIICQQMEEYILYGGVYGNLGNIYKMNAAQGENKTRSFLKLIFPSREEMAMRFPLLKEYPILLPYYQVKRWFRIFNKDKRKNMKRQIDLRSGLSNQEINSTAELLEHLGLAE